MIEKWSLHQVNNYFEIIYNAVGAENRRVQRSHIDEKFCNTCLIGAGA